jgi:hypothetical protein
MNFNWGWFWVRAKKKREKEEEKKRTTLLARDYLQLLKMVGKFIGHCLNFPAIYTGEQ